MFKNINITRNTISKLLRGALVLSVTSICAAGSTLQNPKFIAASTNAECNDTAYIGIQRCDKDGIVYFKVNTSADGVRVETVLAEGFGVSGKKAECTSVNIKANSANNYCHASQALEKYPRQQVGEMVNRVGGVLGINSDLFASDGSHGPEGLTVKNGVRIDGPISNDADNNEFDRGSILISNNGTVSIRKLDKNGNYPQSFWGNEAYNSSGGAPILISGGKQITSANAACNANAEKCSSIGPDVARARTVVGKNSAGHLIMALKSETTTDSGDGKTVDAMKQFMAGIGATDALNLDGGGSTQLYFEGKYIVASSDFGRPVASALVVFAKKQVATSTPVPTPVPTPIQVSCPTTFTWKSEYYNNRYLSGSPTVCRNDTGINFDWGGGNPVAGIGADNFSVRWSGSFAFNTGNYTFIARADDGVRVWVDGQLIIDQWKDQGATEYRVTRVMSAGNHNVRMEYYENGGGAVAQLRWEAAPVMGCPTSYTFKGEYYNNRSLSGNPIVCRNDSAINFDWGNGSPAAGIGIDNFSVRWSGPFAFNVGNYTFIARADDGLRVWVDGQLIIDKWIDQGATEYRVTRAMSAGNHDIKMEYYENGGGAVAQLRWEFVPSPVPSPAPAQPPTVNGPSGFIYCAKEGEVCNISGAKDVAYGTSGKYAYRSISGNFACKNQTFGDPIPGYQKGCFVKDGSQSLPPYSTSSRLIVRHSGMCADIAGVSNDNGAAIIQWDCNNSDNQQWRFDDVGGGYFKIVSKRNSKCLDATGGSNASAQPVVQWDCHGNTNQQWRLENVGNGDFRLIARSSNLCLDVNGQSKSGGARLIQWNCNGGQNQAWRKG